MAINNIEIVDLDNVVEPAVDQLCEIEEDAIKAEVTNWSDGQMAYALTFISSEILFQELEARMNEFKFQINVIKGVLK